MKWVRHTVTYLTFLFLVSYGTTVASAQQNRWSEARLVPFYHRLTHPPFMVADQNQTVHALSTQPVEGDETTHLIWYNQWTAQDGWTEPIDIILPPNGTQATIMGVHLDSNGLLHIVFFSGGDTDAQIYYSWAPAVFAEQSRAWSTPVVIGWDAITPRIARFVADENGYFSVLYSGGRDGFGLYATHSFDNGKTWTEATPVQLTYDDNLKPVFLDSYIGESGYVHAVWNIISNAGRNKSGHYARFDPLSRQWTEPIDLAENIGLGIAVPAVIEHKNNVYVIFNNGHPETGAPVQWVRVSTDFGVSWQNPTLPFTKHIGRNGEFSFVVDGAEDLHVFFGERIPNGYAEGKDDLHGMWHSVLRNGAWTPPDAVVSGPPIEPENPKDLGFDPYDARAVIVQGNTILVTWRTDPGVSKDGVWFSSTTLDVPMSPISSLPIPTPTTQPTATQSTGILVVQPPTTTPKPSLDLDLTISSPSQRNPAISVLVGFIPALLVVLTMVIFSNRRRGR